MKTITTSDIAKEFIEVLYNDSHADGHNILLMHVNIFVNTPVNIYYEVLSSKHKESYTYNHLDMAIKQYNEFYK